MLFALNEDHKAIHGMAGSSAGEKLASYLLDWVDAGGSVQRTGLSK
jgi:hypothetical protein